MKKQILLLIALALACLISQAALAADISVPNTFTSGTPAKAEEVNQNFNTVYSAVNRDQRQTHRQHHQPQYQPYRADRPKQNPGAPFAASIHTHKPTVAVYRWAVFSTLRPGRRAVVFWETIRPCWGACPIQLDG